MYERRTRQKQYNSKYNTSERGKQNTLTKISKTNERKMAIALWSQACRNVFGVAVSIETG